MLRLFPCLWTRNFELCQLQERDLKASHRMPAGLLHTICQSLESSWIIKKDGRVSRAIMGRLKVGNHYDIYEQKDTPEICIYTHFMRWRVVYRQRLGRDFEPDAFPYIAPNGVIHPKKPLSHDLVQEYINEFASGVDHSTGLCLPQFGKRWSLTIIRWWGGWAEGEQVDTLMRYLMDSLQSYESGHGDALNPHRLEADKSFIGDHDALKAPTVAEFRTLSENIFTQLDDFSAQIRSNHSPSNPDAPIHGSVTTAFNFMSLSALAPASAAALPTTATTSSNVIPPNNFSQSSPGQDPSPMDEDEPTTVMPLPAVSIPGVGRDANSWRRAIDQWEIGDPNVGMIPQKDWPLRYYTGPMRLFPGTLYSHRNCLLWNINVFKERYPEHTNITKLLKAIRANSGRTRSSRA
ncbi:hypothetical protein B0H13DRAFT_1857499 [Mycena leptocephala]|nr:hypothetical protein B0H13DRAFT_1857499 [Mycena leptocephala]